MIDREQIRKEADKLREPCAEFLRDLCRIPATSNEEGPVVKRVEKEMKKLGYDEVKIDKYGNILGRIGNGPRVIAYDAHLDTVGVGDRNEWKWDPFEGKYEKGIIWARGSSDQRGGIAAMTYAGSMIKKLGLEAECTIWVVGSVCEEDSDGIAWLYILQENVIKPELVVISEPTSLNVYRGHRGRMEIKVRIKGKSCHASAPERGDNPIYKSIPFIKEIEKMNKKLKPHKFLGKGTISVTQIREEGPSQCAVPGAAVIHLDRRLAPGENKDSSVKEVKEVLKKIGLKPKEYEVWVPTYDVPSWRGTVYPMEQYYPGWCIDEDNSAVQISAETYKRAFNKKPKIDKWIFSTNATASCGLCGVPAIGFGAGEEDNAHSILEHMPVEHLVKAMQFYTIFPTTYTEAGGLAKKDQKYTG